MQRMHLIKAVECGRTLVVLVAATLAVTVSASSCVATTHSATLPSPPSPVGAPLEYVALGSSFAAGPVLAPVVDVDCTRSGANYPHRVAKSMGYTLIDRSCSGATSANILDRPQTPNFGLGATQPPQIQAVTPATDLVTVTIGGNDVDYMGRLVANSCATSFERARPRPPVQPIVDMCAKAGAPPSSEPAPADYAMVEASAVAIVAAVKVRAPGADVVFVDYLPIVPEYGSLCDAVPLTPERAASTIRVHRAVADATARAAEVTGSQLVRASQLGIGHSACSAEPWVAGFEIVQPDSGGAVFYHPNAAGMAAVAGRIVRQIS